MNAMLQDKKLIYIAGCGRSGSTIMGFCLGNATDVLDLGEVLDYARLGGRPNGFGPESENFRYWMAVRERVERDPCWVGLDSFRALQARFDTHRAFPFLVIVPFLLVPFGLRRYRLALKALYLSILNSTNHLYYVDSSKYPSRLLHLSKLFESQVGVLHMVRDPAGLYVASSDGEQGDPKSFVETIIYFVAVNLATMLVTKLFHCGKSLRVSYDKFALNPSSTLKEIRDRFGIDVGPADTKIKNGVPLIRGYILNGNRMRLENSVKFRSGQARCWPRSLDSNFLVIMLRRLFTTPLA